MVVEVAVCPDEELSASRFFLPVDEGLPSGFWERRFRFPGPLGSWELGSCAWVGHTDAKQIVIANAIPSQPLIGISYVLITMGAINACEGPKSHSL